MAKKLSQQTEVLTSTRTGTVDLTKTASPSDVKKDDREAEELIKKTESVYSTRLKNHEGGEWFRYGKAHSKAFGKAFSIEIMPVTYSFQEGLRTFILEEHVGHIIDVFDRRIRAEGADISQSQFTDAELDPANMINGGSL